MSAQHPTKKATPAPKKTAPGEIATVKPVKSASSKPAVAATAAKKVAQQPVKTPAKLPAKASTKSAAVKAEKVAPASKASTAKPTTTPASKTEKNPAKTTVAATKAVKTKKSKLIRDSFTIPDHEYALIASLKERSVKLGVALKKSELLRAGILQLVDMADADFLNAISAVDIIKTGRPPKSK